LPNFKNIIKESTVGVSIMTLPITIGTLLFSEQLISVLYGRGAFDDTAIKITSQALFYYSIGIIGFGFRDILTKVFYSLQETKIPMINAALGMLLNIVLNIILSRYLGIGGLALATSIAATFTTVLLFTSLHKKIGPFGMKQISISFLKILFASSVMGGLAKLSFNYLAASLSQNLSLLMAIGVGVVSYFVIISFMKIEDVDVIVGAIKKKLGSQLYNVKW
jgi:putative peptidoglycan lipid II flippase